MNKKEFITSVVFFILLVVLYALFPVKDKFQNILTALIFFTILPIFYVKYILKKDIKYLGLIIGNIKKGLFYGTISFFIVFSIFYIIIKYTKFLNNYALPKDIYTNFLSFLFYELTLVLLIVIIYEFFFRGFILFTLEKRLKAWAILAQVVLFFLLILFIGGLKWALLPYLVFAPFGGIIAYKSRSLLYSTIVQFLFIILLDAYVIFLTK